MVDADVLGGVMDSIICNWHWPAEAAGEAVYCANLLTSDRAESFVLPIRFKNLASLFGLISFAKLLI